MTYAIRGYFDNDGEVAHIIRLCHQCAAQSFTEWKIGDVDEQGRWTPDSPFGFEYASYRVEATSPGRWANNTRISITYRLRGTSGGPELDFAISVPAEPTQYFTAVSVEGNATPDSEGLPQTFAQLVSESSRFVRFIPQGPTITERAAPAGPHSATWELTLIEGRDSPAGKTPNETQYLDAVEKMGEVPEVALVAVPGLFDDLKGEADSKDQQREVLRTLIEQAEELRDRLVLIDVPTKNDELPDGDQAIREVDRTLKWIEELRDFVDNKATRAAATYHPRLTIQDPLGGIRHPLRNVPPSGHVAGVISRLDRQRGAHYTPANAEIFGTVDITQKFAPVEQARFNSGGVNLLRCSAGNGLVVWGGRTLNLDVDRRFVVYRRLIHRLVRAIRRVAEPLVFDINGPELWLALARSITSVLLEAWRAGALKGDQPAEAFRVQCDEKLNPPEEQDLGRVHCEIAVAPATPMEFIELRVSLSGDGRLEVFES
jgi:phage tail sheath protein FI